METIIGQDIQQAAALLRAGEVVGIPTETVYGLAGNALNDSAIAKIFAVKNRPYFDPLIIHVAHAGAIGHWVQQIPQPLEQLAQAFLPGPLTLLLPKKQVIPDLVTAGLPRVAVRVPGHPLTRELLSRLDFPLAAPSANPFGYISPTQAMHVVEQLGGKIPFVLDGGPCQVGVESTIVSYEEEQIVILRKGGLTIEQIEAVVGPVVVKAHSTSHPAAPGMLKSHYAPRKPLRLLEREAIDGQLWTARTALLLFQKAVPSATVQMALSPGGHLEEAARHLFAYLRALDALDIDEIVAEILPERGLGRAINDRLRRAAV